MREKRKKKKEEKKRRKKKKVSQKKVRKKKKREKRETHGVDTTATGTSGRRSSSATALINHGRYKASHVFPQKFPGAVMVVPATVLRYSQMVSL
jgi:hypothetical protein